MTQEQAPRAAQPAPRPPQGQPPMNFRLTAALFGIVAVLLVTFLVLSLGEKKEPKAASLASELTLAGKKADDVDVVEFERPGSGPLVIARTDKNKNLWQIQKPINTPAEAARVGQVVNALLRAKPTPYQDISTNPAVHGLDPASLKITLRAGDTSSTVSLGDLTLGDKGVVFVTSSSQPKRPMAVRRGDLDALFREPKDGKAGDLAKWTPDFRSPNVFPSDSRAAGEDVSAVRLELPNKKKELALARPNPTGPWRFDSPTGWGDADTEGDAAGSPNTFTGVRRLLGALTSVSAANPTDFIDSPKDLKEYGLNPDNPDLVKVRVQTREGQSATVLFGKSEGAAAPGMPPQGPGAKMYVQVEGQPGVIRATAADLSGLVGVINDPSPLRDRTLIGADRAKADGIDIVLAGQPATKLRRSGQLPLWKLYGGPNDPQNTNGEAVNKLLDVVFARRTIKDFPASNPANFAAVPVTLFVWADGFNQPADEKAEPVKKGEPIKLEFGRRDAGVVYVRRTLPGQPPAEFTVPEQIKVGVATESADVLAAVTKSRLDLLDRSLPSFSDAVRIAVTGANNYTLARDTQPDPLSKEVLWRFDPADPRKGQVADGGTVRNEMIYRLANLSSSFGRFVDEQPSAEKLAGEYGLTPPRLKVTVDLPAGTDPKQATFEFGKDAPDGDKVYARVAGRAAVFTVQRRVFDVCLNPDLRDRYIFRAVDAPNVNKVELKGWGDVGFQTELTFEKNKDGAWAATKAPPGFVADQVKVAAFVDLLARLQAKTFEKGPAQPAHGFGDPKQSLQVTLHWPGGAVALNIGATPDGGATYHGWSAWLPQSDPVFTFEGALFKPYKDRPGGLAR